MRPVLGRGMHRASDAVSRDVGSSGQSLSVGSVPERSRQMGPPMRKAFGNIHTRQPGGPVGADRKVSPGRIH